MEQPRRRPVVAILGGGFTGAAVAFHLARGLPREAAEIIVVEPRAELGRGLAYSTTDPAHRLNVPASKMTLVSDDLGHFMAWLAAGPVPLSAGTLTARGDFFPERQVFGRYVASHLQPLLDSGAVRHARTEAVSAVSVGTGYRIGLSDGRALAADIVVLAMSHPQPRLPRALQAVAASPRIVADPYDLERVHAIGPADRVLVIGQGLTSADVIASLDRRGFWGEVTALSRHGLRSRGHGVVREICEKDFAAPTTRALVRQIRAAVSADAARGQTWHAVFDRLRQQGPAIWARLDETERRRLVRHLRPLWDVHRFRVSPQVEEVLDKLIARQRLQYVAAYLVGVAETDLGLDVTLRPRGGAEKVTRQFDTVVVTTGPSHADILRTNPVFASLHDTGELKPDALGLGLKVIGGSGTVDGVGQVLGRLFLAGPLARGQVGELMGIPEVTRHAEETAAAVIQALSAGEKTSPQSWVDAVRTTVP